METHSVQALLDFVASLRFSRDMPRTQKIWLPPPECGALRALRFPSIVKTGLFVPKG
jgi:hypothetical protein